MNLIIRLICVFVESFFRRRLHPLAESIVHLTVWPNDLDLNMHMNNGRYLTVMDLGRLDLLIRSGLAGEAFRRRWQPLVGGVNIHYRYSLAPFQRYRLHSKVVAWDEKWFFIEQRFTRGNRLIAVAHVKALFRGHGRNISPKEILKAAHVNIDPPEVPAKIQAWLKMDETRN